MIQFIKHRINSIKDLDSVDPSWGVEIDLRSVVDSPGQIHLSHDPWRRGDDLQNWLTAFKERKVTGPVILNTKEDGLESTLIELMDRHKITNYFFLDTALPTLVRWTINEKKRNFALRLSSYENIQNILPFEKFVDWVWVDCFNGHPLDEKVLALLVGRFKLCLVSPELQGQPLDTMRKFTALAKHCSAICTKRPDLWLNRLELPQT